MSREAARDLFFAVGTDKSRRIDWIIWHAAEPGSRIVVATLARVVDAVVLERPLAVDAETEIIVLGHTSRQLKLKMFKSASAGYWDRHPEKRFPGCDRDVVLDGVSARLVELRPRAPEQLGLFGG